MPITFTVWGVPIAQPRTRAMGRISKQGKPFAHVYEPGNKHSPARQWKSDIRVAAKIESGEAMGLIDGPVKLWASFFMPRTKELYKDKYPVGPIPHTVRPDVENLLKLLMDALTGVLIHDDKQIYQVNVCKWYHEKSTGPRVTITVGDIKSSNGLEVDMVHKSYL